MKRIDNLPGTISAWLLGALLCMGSLPAMSTHGGTHDPVEDLDIFELDGNAVESFDPPNDPNKPIPGDDWETLYIGGGTASTFTGIVEDPDTPHQIFSGGVKDILNISSDQNNVKTWSWTTGSVPDKNDIKHAFAASYDHTSGDRIIYFGADRFSNVGDAFMGFWFFKKKIMPVDGGKFSGTHTEGDILVLANFPQANNAVPLIQVVAWDPSCPKDETKPQDTDDAKIGKCVAKNLRLLAGASGPGAICGNGGIAEACAITNEVTETSPWSYTSKDGFIMEFPFESFFEGGINISALLPDGDGCFASFMAETRSSSSFTADLKDFVLDEFPVCSTDIATEIHSNTADDPAHSTDYQTTYDSEGNPIGAGLPAGSGVHDLAKITFSAPSGFDVLGTVTFTTYANACSELLDENGDLLSELPGSLDTYNVDIDFTTNITNGGVLLVESNGWADDKVNSGESRDDIDFPNAGTFAYLVQFTSSTGGIPDSDYHCEQLTVSKLTPDVVTRIHEGSRAVSSHPDTDIQTTFNEDGSIKVEGIVEVGTIIHDLGEVKGKNGLLPDGTITFEFYDDDKCGANGGSLLNGDGSGNPTDMKELTEPASGVIAIAESSDFDTTGYFSDTDGDTKGFSILARYSGDNNYAPATATTCESLTVSKRTPSIETHVTITEQAMIVGDGNTIAGVGDPTGQVKFDVYEGGDCDNGTTVSGSPFTVAITGKDSNNELIVKLLQDFLVRSDDGSAVDTTVAFRATYPGDNNYISVQHDCEIVDILLPARSSTPTPTD